VIKKTTPKIKRQLGKEDEEENHTGHG